LVRYNTTKVENKSQSTTLVVGVGLLAVVYVKNFEP